MNHFSVYWLKNEFLEHFFYKGDILYRFISSYHHNKTEEYLNRQFNYVMNSLDNSQLISCIEQFKPPQTNILIDNDKLDIYNNSQYISLHIYEKHLIFCCTSLEDAEQLLFPILRKYYPFLFVISHNTHTYGWLSPVTYNLTKKDGQLLYSYR